MSGYPYSFKVALGQTRGKSIPASLPLALAPPTINNSPLPDYLVPPAPVGLLAALALAGPNYWLFREHGRLEKSEKRIQGERNFELFTIPVW